MKFSKQIFAFLIFDIVLFILYYVIMSFIGAFQIEGIEAALDMVMSTATWIGFFLLYVLKTADRKGPGLEYLLENEKAPVSPLRSFDLLSEMKRGNFDLLIYALICLIPGWAYHKEGIVIGTGNFVSEIFLPQTLIYKISGSPVWGYIISVALFYILSSTVLAVARSIWVKTPLTDEERIKVDPEWIPESQDPTIGQ